MLESERKGVCVPVAGVFWVVGFEGHFVIWGAGSGGDDGGAGAGEVEVEGGGIVVIFVVVVVIVVIVVRVWYFDVGG